MWHLKSNHIFIRVSVCVIVYLYTSKQGYLHYLLCFFIMHSNSFMPIFVTRVIYQSHKCNKGKPRNRFLFPRFFNRDFSMAFCFLLNSIKLNNKIKFNAFFWISLIVFPCVLAPVSFQCASVVLWLQKVNANTEKEKVNIY